jgi:outer membrane protein assembly factor BamA/autotransporter translocation and assembly factor TamB
VLIGLAVAVAVLAVLAGVAHLPPVRGMVLNRLTAELHAYGIDARADALDYNLFTLEFRVHHLTLASRGQDARPFLTADDLYVNLPWSALTGGLSFQSIAVAHPTVTIVRGADGITNLPALGGGGSGAPLAVAVDALAITNLQATIADEANHARVVTGSLSAHFTRANGTLAGRVDLAAPAHITWNGRQTVIMSLGGHLAFDGSTLQVDDFHVALPEATAQIDGRVSSLTSAPQLALSVDGQADLARVAAWLPTRPRISGPVAVAVRIEGPAAAPHATIRFQTTLAGGALEGTGQIAYAKGESPGRMHLAWTGVPLAPLLAMLPSPVHTAVRSTMTGELDASWSELTLPAVTVAVANAGVAPAGARVGVSGHAEGHLAGGRWAATVNEQVGPALHLSGGLSGVLADDMRRSTVAGQVTATTEQIAQAIVTMAAAAGTHAPSTSMAGPARADLAISGTIAEPRFKATVTAPQLVVAGSSPAAVTATLSGNSKVVSGSFEASLPDVAMLARSMPALRQAAGSLRATGTIAGSWSNPRIDATIAGSDLQLDAAPLGPLTAHVAIDQRTLTAQAELPAWSTTIDSTLSLTPFGAFTIDGHAAPADLAAVLTRLRYAPPFPISGSLAFDVSAHGHLQDPRATTATLDLRHLDGSLGQVPIDLAAPARIRYTGTAIEAAPMRLRLGGSELQFAGGIGEGATTPLTISLHGDLQEVQPLARLLDARASGRDHHLTLGGAVDFAATATGSLTKPALSGELALRGGRIAAAGLPPISDLTLEARYRDGALALSSLTAAWQGATVEASGSLAANASGPVRLDARIANITPALAAFALPDSMLQQIDGHVDATLTIEGARPALSALHGEVTLQQAALSIGGVPLQQQQPTRFTLADGRLQIAAFNWNDGTTTLRNRLTAQGSMDLRAPRALNVDLSGNLDLRMLSAISRNLSAAGRASLAVHAGGTLAAPSLGGRIDIVNGELRYTDPELVVSGLSGAIELTPAGLTIPGMTGEVNGGSLRIAGALDYRGPKAGQGGVTIVANDAALNLYGLRTQIDSQLALGLSAGQLALTGSVNVLRGAYRAPFTLTGGLMAALQQQAITVTAGRPSPLQALALDVDITTAQDIEIDNSYAQLAIGLDLTLAGTVAQPGLTGRATVREGGEIFLGGNTYRISGNGAVDFIDPDAIVPDFDIKAATRVAGNDITLSLSGTPQRLTTDLSSPGLSQADVVSLLLTGRTAEPGSAAQMAFGTGQLLGYLSGEFLGAAGRALGLSTLRIESGLPEVSFDPSLVASETNPSTRLTFGRDVTSTLRLIFSQSLTDSGGLAWIVSYMPRRTIDLRAMYLDGGIRRYDFMQELTSAGSPLSQIRGTRTPPLRVGAIDFHGDATASRATLLSKLRVGVGDPFNFFRWQNDRDRLLAFFHEEGHAEAHVRAERSTEPGDVTLTYTIHPGPQTLLTIEGARLPSTVRGQMEDAWERSVFDGFLLDDMRSMARAYLAGEGYLQANVTATVVRATDTVKEIRVDVVPGPRTPDRRLAFTGNRRLSTDELQALVDQQGLRLRAWTDPQAVSQAIRTAYDLIGNLTAQVSIGEPRFDGAHAVLPIAIAEGPVFRIQTVHLSGLLAKSPTQVRAALDLPPGTIYSPVIVQRAIGRVDALYRGSGFNAEHASLQVDLQRESGAVDLSFSVDEGPRQVLTDVVSAGARRTDPDVITRALKFTPGAPVDRADWALARKRLYDTGAFKSVDIEAEPMQIGPPAPGPDGVPTEPVRARVTLEEWPALRFRYGFQVQDEPSNPSGRTVRPGVAGDLLFRNLLGHAMTFGAAGQLTRDYRAGRTYLTAPTMFGLPVLTNLYVERSHEVVTPSDTDAVLSDASTVTAEQRINLHRTVQLLYSYSFERNHTFEEHPDPTNPFAYDLTVNIARLTTAAYYDTRNDLVNATQGLFTSSTFEYSPPALGSDLRFVKYLFQQQYFRPLGSGLVFATNGRLGLATAFGQELIPSERFFAGGGNSVRGYADSSLGPTDFLGPSGGSAMLVLNEELRFPIVGIIRGVGFFDAGNVFPGVADLSLTGLDTATGFGVRINTPFALLRVDYGIPLVRTPGMPFGRWFFSIGQAF